MWEQQRLAICRFATAPQKYLVTRTERMLPCFGFNHFMGHVKSTYLPPSLDWLVKEKWQLSVSNWGEQKNLRSKGGGRVGGVSLNTHLKQVGEGKSRITKTSEKASCPPRAVFCTLWKRKLVHTGNQTASICSITADSDLYLIKSNSTFPSWHSRKKGIFPTALQLLF